MTGRNQFSHNRPINGKKKCNKCLTWQPLTSFHINKECQGGVVGTCRICTAIKNRQWYADNRARRQQAANDRNQARKKEAVNNMGGQCYDCKGEFPLCVYDFHHVMGKDVNPSVALTWKKAERERELAKCILLCANCHRIRHFGNDRKKER